MKAIPGLLNDFSVIFDYNIGDEEASKDAKRFLEIKRIVEKEVAKEYPKITQPETVG